MVIATAKTGVNAIRGTYLAEILFRQSCILLGFDCWEMLVLVRNGVEKRAVLMSVIKAELMGSSPRYMFTAGIARLVAVYTISGSNCTAVGFQPHCQQPMR